MRLPLVPGVDSTDPLYELVYRDHVAFQPTETHEWAEPSILVRIIENKLAALALRHIKTSDIVSKETVIAGPLYASALDMALLSEEVIVANRFALEVLKDAGFDYVVTKGPGIARFHPYPSERPYSDLDILVQSNQYVKILDLLRRKVGYVERKETQQPWRTLDLRCREAINLVAPNGGRLDVHQRIPPWRWTRQLTFADIYERGAIESVHGVPIRMASRLDNLAISLYHIYSDRNRPGRSLMVWRDIASLLAGLDPAVVADHLVKLKMGAWALWVLKSLPEDLDCSELVDQLGSRSGDAIPHSVSLRLSMGAASDSIVVSQACRLPPLRAVLFMVGMIFPPSAFLRARLGHRRHPYLSWWGSGLANGMAFFGQALPERPHDGRGVAR